MASGHSCPNLALKTGLSAMLSQRCPPVVAPATPSSMAIAAVMKNPTTTTTTNKASERVWSLLQGDDCFFLKEEITEMHAALLPYISK